MNLGREKYMKRWHQQPKKRGAMGFEKRAITGEQGGKGLRIHRELKGKLDREGKITWSRRGMGKRP